MKEIASEFFDLRNFDNCNVRIINDKLHNVAVNISFRTQHTQHNTHVQCVKIII